MFGFGRKTWPKDVEGLARVMARPFPNGSRFLSDEQIARLLTPALKANRREDWRALAANLRAQGDGRSAAMAYDVMLGRFHGKWPDDLREAARIFFRLRLKDKEIAPMLTALAENAANEDAWARLATQLRGAGKIKCAEVIYDAALARFPKSAKLWGNCGVLYRNQARFRDAETVLRKAVALRPDYKIALHNLGSVFELSKRFDAAIPFYERVLQIDPAYAPSWTGLGICRQTSDPAEAERCFRHAIELDPSYSVPLFNLALLYARTGAMKYARGAIVSYLEKWPNDEAAVELEKKFQSEEAVDISNMENPADEVRIAFRLPKNLKWDGERMIDPGLTVSSSMQLIAPTPDQDCFALRPLDRFEMADPGPLPAKVERLLFEPQQLIDAPGTSSGFFQTTQMRSHVREHLAQKPPAAPRVFLSYQRDPELAVWMKSLRSELKRRGYEVILDEDVSSGATVPYVVSLVATCNVFCPVLTDGYFERIDPGDERYGRVDYLDDGWAFDEFQLAMALAGARRAIVVGLWRSGTLLPPFKRSNVLDLRRDGDLPKALDQVFKKRRR